MVDLMTTFVYIAIVYFAIVYLVIWRGNKKGEGKEREQKELLVKKTDSRYSKIKWTYKRRDAINVAAKGY